MLADSYIVPECIATPRSLGALMALYEGNFIKLKGLTPGLLAGLASEPSSGAVTRSSASGLESRSRELVSRADRDLDLYLNIEGVTRYTVDARLTYRFDEPTGCIADPDLRLRLYLDARMVEVLGWSISHRHEILRQLAINSARELDRRWSQNIMLGKWLDYLRDMGHGFQP